MLNNPKIEGSNIIDCIPQIGDCPIKCQECYYNSPTFYRINTTPLIPTLEEVGDKIVRVNSGHDSNINKPFVLEVTKQYSKKFYNTSLPGFDFPSPVVFTCNGKYTDTGVLIVIKNLHNLMYVRFRTNTWNIDLLEYAIKYYALENKIPITLTFMRYKDEKNIPIAHLDNYEYKKHILNSYFEIKQAVKQKIWYKYSYLMPLVGMCGTLTSNYCKDCRRCEWAYAQSMNCNLKEFPGQ